jgi:hypothetical protein
VAAGLFAFYPLHFEATAWLGGIASELSTFFFLASFFIYLQGRQNALGWGRIALVSTGMFLAITSSALIWPACLAFALFELASLLWPDRQERHSKLTMTLICVLLPVVITGACLAAQQAPAAAFPGEPRLHSLFVFLRRTFFPVNEINWRHYAREYLQFYALYPFLALSLLCGSIFSAEIRRATLYLFLLFLLLALPVIGVAVAHSDLYGERWLYAASAPFCMLLACSLTFLLDQKGKSGRAAYAGAVILSILVMVTFLQNLTNEIAANRNLARVLKAVQKSIKIRQERDRPDYFIVKDLPEKISICPLYSARGPVLVEQDSGLLRSNPLPDGRLKKLLRAGRLAQAAMRWDDDLKSLMSLDLGAENAIWPEKMSAEQLVKHMAPALEYCKNACLSQDHSELLLESNSENGAMITLDPYGLSTLDGDYIYLAAVIDAPARLAAPRIEFYWQTRIHPHYEKRERFCYTDAIVNDGKVHNYLLSLRSNAWTTGGQPTILAMGFPAGARVRIKEAGLLRLTSAKTSPGILPVLPTLEPVCQNIPDLANRRFTPPYLNYPLANELGMIALSESAQAIEADYSVVDIEGARSILVELSNADRDFQDANSNHLSSQTYKTLTLPGQRGRISIPVSELPSPGIFSLRVIARDERGAYLGQFSDSLCYQVPVKKKG